MTPEPATAPQSDVVLRHLDARGVARIAINRPEVRNAWDADTIAALRDAIATASATPAVRVVVLTGEGKSFSAGGDLRWMRSVLDLSSQQRREDAIRIGELLAAIDSCSKPVVARINGAAIGGGLGLVCACDIAIASEEAVFGLSEVRLGLVPAMISPFVVRRLGEAQARARLLTGRDPMPAAEALAIGLVHRVVARDDLDAAVESEIRTILRSAPGAVAAAKQLFRRASARDADDAITAAAEALVRTWEGAEAREGLSALLEKRKPSWS